jgi:hypothetical protein
MTDAEKTRLVELEQQRIELMRDNAALTEALKQIAVFTKAIVREALAKVKACSRPADPGSMGEQSHES